MNNPDLGWYQLTHTCDAETVMKITNSDIMYLEI